MMLSMVANCKNTSTLHPSKRASRSRSRTIIFPLVSTGFSSTTSCCVHGSRGQSNRKRYAESVGSVVVRALWAIHRCRPSQFGVQQTWCLDCERESVNLVGTRVGGEQIEGRGGQGKGWREARTREWRRGVRSREAIRSTAHERSSTFELENLNVSLNV